MLLLSLLLLLLFFFFRRNAGVDDTFVKHDQYNDEVTYKIIQAAAYLLGKQYALPYFL